MKADEMRSFIHSLRGKYKFDTGGKSFTDWMADLNQEEKKLEEKKLQKMALILCQ